MAMWATLGAVFGVVLRSVALPIGLGVVWILGIENLISAVARTSLTALQPLRDVLPGVSPGSLISSVLPAQVGPLPPGVQSTVSGGQGLVTVAAYAAVAALAVLAVGRRRDVAAQDARVACPEGAPGHPLRHRTLVWGASAGQAGQLDLDLF